MSQFFTSGGQSIGVSASASALLTGPSLGSMSEVLGDPASGFTSRFMTDETARELQTLWFGEGEKRVFVWVPNVPGA